MPFGQVVIGPPGSGKTTYCNGIQQYLTGLGRKVAIVNLDPANDTLPYEADVDVSELVHLEEVMERCRLGPNGGLLYCMDYLHENLDWLRNKLSQYEKENYYFLFDCPGQVELFTTSSSFRGILTELTGKWHYRLAAIHLVDAHLCTDGSKYLSALLLSLTTMLYLELPHINVLSKMDLIQAYGDLQFNLDFYTEVQDLQHLVNAMSPSRFSRKYRKLSEGLCDVVDGYGLLSFHPLAIQDKESVQQLMGLVDKCNGYVFAGLASHNPYPPEMLYGSSVRASDQDLWRDMQDKYVKESEHAGLLGQVMEIERDKGQERER